MSVICNLIIFSIFHFLTLSLGWSAVDAPNFDDIDIPVNRRLLREYGRFHQTLASHLVYQPSKAVTNPLVDYILFLTSYSENKETAKALDHMLKTSGPFGFSDKPADEQEKVFIAGAAQAIAQIHHDLVTIDYDSSNTDHLTEIRRLQGAALAGAVQHPYHPVITLPPSAQPLADGLKPDLDQSGRWQTFLDLLKDEKLSKRQFAAKTVTGKAKADWVNDIILCGYQMGVLPDVEGLSSPPRPRNYLDDSWKNDNSWMEDEHNYVQWWFMIHTIGQGDGIAPRFTEETRQTLNDHRVVLTEVQKMLRMSFARKVTFWGQKLTQFRVIMSLDTTEDQTLRKPVSGKNWHENWIINTHNYLRMNRFLMCFHLFGLNDELNALYAYLGKTVKEENTSPKNNTYIKGSLDRFWSQAKVGKPGVGRDEGYIPASVSVF